MLPDGILTLWDVPSAAMLTVISSPVICGERQPASIANAMSMASNVALIGSGRGWLVVMWRITFVEVLQTGLATGAQKYCIIHPLFDAAGNRHHSIGDRNSFDAQPGGNGTQ